MSSGGRQDSNRRGHSTSGEPRRSVTLSTVAGKKAAGEPIVMVTAYDFPSAQLADEAGVDVILVGDSAANCVLGYASTVPIELDEMIMLASAVRRGATTPLLVVDMPFGSYEGSDQIAVANAQRIIKRTGADAVKLEGAGTSAGRARAIIAAGIPVMGHVGLTPQTAVALGGLKAQGRTAEAARRLLEGALALDAAGCFSVVLEAVPAAVAEVVTRRLKCPTIGIGAGPGTDGQVLVFHDLLGITTGKMAKFVKTYADIHGSALDGLSAYAEDVRAGTFPADEHCYRMPDDELARFRADVGANAGSRAPQWIVFDFGNVLSRPDAGPPAIARLLGIDEERVAAAYWPARAGYDLDDDGYWPGVLAELGIDASVDSLAGADDDAWLELEAESAELLADLHGGTVPMALLSNAGSSFGSALRRTDAGGFFSQIVVSGEVGIAKPDSRIFSLLLSRLGDPDPSAVVFFDDKQVNVDAARAAGIDAVVWTGATDAREALRARNVDLLGPMA